jgi:hypothetical protein
VTEIHTESVDRVPVDPPPKNPLAGIERLGGEGYTADALARHIAAAGLDLALMLDGGLKLRGLLETIEQKIDSLSERVEYLAQRFDLD